MNLDRNLYILQEDTINTSANLIFMAKHVFVAPDRATAYKHFAELFPEWIECDDEDFEDGEKYAQMDAEEQATRRERMFSRGAWVWEISLSSIAGL